MISFECFVQEGCVPEEIHPNLAAELSRISTSMLGGSPDDVDVRFIEIPRGFGFRGGEPSTASVLSVGMPDGCEQQTRVQLIHQISDMWCEISGSSTDELVVWAVTGATRARV